MFFLPIVVSLQTGISPLHLTAKEGNVKIADALLENGASPGIQTKVRLILLPDGLIKKCSGFEKMLLPEYQSNDIERCFVLFPICPIRFSNLPGFDQPFLSVEMGRFSAESPLRNPAKNE